MIHTDTLNESGFVEDTIAAFKDRTIHAFHTEVRVAATPLTSSRSLACRMSCRPRPSHTALHRQHHR